MRSIQNEEEAVADEEEVDVSAVPDEWKSKMCTFLEKLGLFKEAMQLCDNDDKKFDLAIKLNDTKVAVEIARKTNSYSQL